MNYLRCKRKRSHLCVCSAYGLNFFQHPPGQAGTGLEWNSRISPSCRCTIPADQPRPAVSFRAAKPLSAALLTDAQLVSDGHSSLELNGARVKMKAGGPFMYKPSSWSSHFILSVFPWVRKLNHLRNVLQIFFPFSLVTQTCLSGD